MMKSSAICTALLLLIASVPSNVFTDGGGGPIRGHDRAVPAGVNGLSGSESGVEAKRFPQLPGVREQGDENAAQVSDSTLSAYMNRLVDFRTRFSCTDSNTAASRWIHDTFRGFGFTDVSYDSFPMGHTLYPCTWQWNVVAVKPGTLYPERYVLIGGHYDSVTYFSECGPDTLAPGADDNATGTAATLEVARLLAGEETDLTLIFVAFGAEEAYTPPDLWMIGSEHFAEEAYGEGMDFRLVVNMDVVGFRPDSAMDVRIAEGSETDAYSEILAEMAERYTPLIPHVEVGFGSDEIPFHDRGYSTIFVAEWTYSPYWHTCLYRQHAGLPGGLHRRQYG
jgi:hypothetical protein